MAKKHDLLHKSDTGATYVTIWPSSFGVSVLQCTRVLVDNDDVELFELMVERPSMQIVMPDDGTVWSTAPARGYYLEGHGLVLARVKPFETILRASLLGRRDFTVWEIRAALDRLAPVHSEGDAQARNRMENATCSASCLLRPSLARMRQLLP